eukprot:GHVU01013879.1.p1 GENE.GHVU01013879.1~~GHVU01013879.1.p1  ORF type:complete len:297 (+),score=0.80 GHVU01013879.1:398-1288(+)
MVLEGVHVHAHVVHSTVLCASPMSEPVSPIRPPDHRSAASPMYLQRFRGGCSDNQSHSTSTQYTNHTVGMFSRYPHLSSVSPVPAAPSSEHLSGPEVPLSLRSGSSGPRQNQPGGNTSNLPATPDPPATPAAPTSRRFPFRPSYAYRYLYRPKDEYTPGTQWGITLVCVLCEFFNKPAAQCHTTESYCTSNLARIHERDDQERAVWRKFNEWIPSNVSTYVSVPIQEAGKRALCDCLMGESGPVFASGLVVDEATTYTLDKEVGDFIRRRYVPHMTEVAFNQLFVPTRNESNIITE